MSPSKEEYRIKMRFFPKTSGGGSGLAVLLIASIACHAGAFAWVGWTRATLLAPTLSSDDTIEFHIIQNVPEEILQQEPIDDPIQESQEEVLPEMPAEPEPEPIQDNPPPPPQPAVAPQPVAKQKPQLPQPVLPRTQGMPPTKKRTSEAVPDHSKNPPPRYPETARRAKFEGRVLVRANVSVAGKVQGVSLLRSSGHGVLDRAALDAVRRWRFRPRMVDGVSEASAVEVPVHFFLK